MTTENNDIMDDFSPDTSDTSNISDILGGQNNDSPFDPSTIIHVEYGGTGGTGDLDGLIDNVPITEDNDNNWEGKDYS